MINRLTFSSFILVAFLGCSSYNDIKHEPTFIGEIKDNEAWYNDENNDVIPVKISVQSPNLKKCAPYSSMNSTPRECTLIDVVHDFDAYDTYQPELNTLITTENFNATVENSVLKLRGDYSRKSAVEGSYSDAVDLDDAKVKSYSVKLNSGTNLLWNQRKLQFSKYKSDTTGIKNRLAFSLMRSIPNITSVKMQFVNLFIDDEDYGLYTHVEAIREEYLVNRGWNKNDRLYNAGNCMFEVTDELEVDASGKPLDEEAFDTILEIRTGDDHSNVMKMMKAINSDLPIDIVIDKYFDRENYITWLAINLVLSNKDTTYHNFYLYNPLYSEKFYFIPWDYDGAWATKNYLGKNEYGISVWWKTPLHRKFLSVPTNLAAVYAKADLIREEYITDKKVQEILDLMKPALMEFSLKEPDSLFRSSSSWEERTDKLIRKVDDAGVLTNGIEYNINLYKGVIGHPMPFWQALKYEDNKLTIVWGKSIDLEGDEIVYDIRISKDINFLIEAEDIFSDYGVESNSVDQTYLYAEIQLEINNKYYLKIISREKNDSSHYQISHTRARDENNDNTINAPSSTRFGVLEFTIDENGELDFEDESDLLNEEEE